MLGNPLSAGVSNGFNEIMAVIPDGTAVLTWTGNSFDTAIYDASLGLSANNWYQSDGFTPLAAIPTAPPGRGFFISPGLALTNTFVGTVIPNVGATNSLAIPNGFSIVSSVLPVGGAATNAVLNLPLLDGMAVLKWTGNSYDTFVYDGSLGISADGWYLSDGFTPGPVPNLAVGEGFFYNPGQVATWKQTLNP
jgi:hypothetical protein